VKLCQPDTFANYCILCSEAQDTEDNGHCWLSTTSHVLVFLINDF